MAIINCPECTREISSSARKCPNCGAPVKQLAVPIEEKQHVSHQIKWGWMLGVLGIFLAVNGAAKQEVVFLVPIGAVLLIAGIVFLIRNYKKKWDNR